MGQVMSKQLMSSSEGATKQKARAVTVTLWTVQILLAFIFLLAGSMKLILPIEMMTVQMPLPGQLLRFIGVCEVAGALGLILPGLTRIQRRLTPLAACGLVGDHGRGGGVHTGEPGWRWGSGPAGGGWAGGLRCLWSSLLGRKSLKTPGTLVWVPGSM